MNDRRQQLIIFFSLNVLSSPFYSIVNFLIGRPTFHCPLISVVVICWLAQFIKILYYRKSNFSRYKMVNFFDTLTLVRVDSSASYNCCYALSTSSHICNDLVDACSVFLTLAHNTKKNNFQVCLTTWTILRTLWMSILLEKLVQRIPEKCNWIQGFEVVCLLIRFSCLKKLLKVLLQCPYENLKIVDAIARYIDHIFTPYDFTNDWQCLSDLIYIKFNQSKCILPSTFLSCNQSHINKTLNILNSGSKSCLVNFILTVDSFIVQNFMASKIFL